MPTSANQSVKTPIITWVKESVAAAIGVSIIVGLYFLLWSLLTKDPPDVQGAQSIFALLGGWGGIVLGYYFGRLPAERAVTRAEQTAMSAETARDNAMLTKATALTESLNTIRQYREMAEKYKKDALEWKKAIAELLEES